MRTAEVVWVEVSSMQPFLYLAGIRFTRYRDPFASTHSSDSAIEQLIGPGAPWPPGVRRVEQAAARVTCARDKRVQDEVRLVDVQGANIRDPAG